ncbi:TonB-dependent receptor [Horticoccus sp. 23ND18S-11]|uniref:TonB-dependent receptor n=1 Tax=Horticoccus sp. 23ND18S-11 TaxID=3391832 RepID=UPI0039C8FC0A
MTFVRLCTAAAAAMVFSCALPAAESASGVGAITGRVYNPATGEYVASAEVRIAGTSLSTVTEQDGVFRFTQVPAGPHVVTVTYTGAKAAPATIEVRAGETLTRDFELTSAGGEVQRLGAFVIRSEREGNAKAIMEQRRSMNLTNTISSDFFGDVAEGSVGEFLKNVPGVDVDYVGPDARGPRLRGLDPQYVGVSVDGMKLASADGSQGTGGGARSFSFDQVSVNSVDRIEVNYTSSADMDADAPAGTINLKTKRAFERKGRRLSWQAHFMANGDNFTADREYGPSDFKTRKFRPGAILEYSDVLIANRLGVVLNISESSQYVVQSRVDHTYNAVPTATDPRPRVLTGVTFTSNPRLTERFTPSLTLDFKATPLLVLSLSAMYNHFDAFIDSRVLTFTTSGRAVISGDGLNNFAVANGGGTLGLSTNHEHKFAQTRTVTPKFEFRRGPWLVEGGLHYTISTNQYVALSRVGPQTAPVAALTGLGLQLRRSSLRDVDWQVTQTGGRDFADPANFTNPRIGDDMRFAEDEIYQAQVGARYTTGWSVPTWFKFGGKVTEDYHRFRNPNAYLTWRYDGLGGGTNGSFANLAFPQNRWELANGVDVRSSSGGVPVFPNRTEISRLFRERPEYFTNLATAANYFTAFIDNPSYIKETLRAGYGMANTRLNRLQLQAGLRWEETGFASREFDARSAADVRAAGFAVTAANGRATTIPGLTYQYMSRPKITRESSYDHLFPTASAKYAFAENLQAHFGYSSTISRPAIGNLGGVWVFNETAQTVNVPNPTLRPERSKNFSGRMAYYFEPVGSAAITAFQNDITDSVITDEFDAAYFGYGDDPTYASYRFVSVGNRPGTTRVRGFTLEYNQALSFLPGALKGLNVSASYTRTYASALKAAMVPHMAGGTLSYRFRRLAFGASGKWTDATPMTSTGVITYRKARTMIDLNGSYQLSNRLGAFFQVRNLYNIPEYRYQVDPSYILSHVLVGTFYTFGIKGVF